MASRSKSKGMRGEYEAAAILQTVKDEVAEKLGKLELSTRIVRNLEQTRSGGFDLTGTFNYAVEVKFQEQFALNDWWHQAVTQCPDHMIPVLMYRKAGVKFRVRMFTYALVGTRRVRVLSDMDLISFLTIFRLHCEDEFKKL
mgnify:FL=1